MAEEHGSYAAPSSEHWKREPASLLENVNVASVRFVGSDGTEPEPIVVSGSTVSGSVTVHV